MWVGCRRLELRAFFQTLLILLLVDLLIFPAGLTAQASGTLQWESNVEFSGSYTDTNWSCLSGSCGASTYPDNINLDAIINSGSVDLVNPNPAGININSMTLGDIGSLSSATLTVGGGNSITFGTPGSTGNPHGNVLAIGNGGTLNIGNGSLNLGNGSVTLELSGGGNALNAAGGNIAITYGGNLTLQNIQSSSRGKGASTFVDNGNISVIGTSSAAASLILNDGDTNSTFTLTSNHSNKGVLTLGGMGQIYGQSGDENLVNDVGHTITGSGTISSLNLTNNGTITANGGILVLDLTSTGQQLTFTNASGANLNVSDGAALAIQNTGVNITTTIANSGTITLNGTTSSLTLNDGMLGNSGAFLLNGGGAVNLNGNLITGSAVDESFTNADNTITGPGTISKLNLTNNGTITASGGTLILDVTNSTGQQLTNALGANLNVSDGATLTIQNTGVSSSTTIANSGTITLNGTTSSLTLSDGMLGNKGAFLLNGGGTVNLNGNLITGSTGDESFTNADNTITGPGTISKLNLTNNGTITAASGTLILDVSASSQLTNVGALNVSDASTLTILDTSGNGKTTINNTGNINLNGDTSITSLVFNSGINLNTFKLTGGGQVTLTDNANNSITGLTGNESLVNVDNMIQGSGSISNFAKFVNVGTLTPGTAGLTIDLTQGAQDKFINAGPGVVNINGGTSLKVSSNTGTDLRNYGNINVGDGTANVGTLTLNDNLNGAKFYLGGDGFVTLSNGTITGGSGDETLVNGYYQTTQGSGTISNFAKFVNVGILAPGTAGLTIDLTKINPVTGFQDQFINTGAGVVGVAGGTSLTVVSNTGTDLRNYGNINVGDGTANVGTLTLNDNLNGAKFYLGGDGFVTLSNGTITGGFGDETLVNGYYQTIQGSGTISNFAKFVNVGILAPGTAVLTIDLTNANPTTGFQDQFINTGAGIVGVAGGSSLTILSNTGTDLRNYGNIYVGDGTANVGTLTLNDSGNGAKFYLGGDGAVTLTNGSISGGFGDEKLVNGYYQTIQGDGTISNFAKFVNVGILAPDPEGLTIDLTQSAQDQFINTRSGVVGVAGGSSLTIASNTGTFIRNDGAIFLGDGSGNAGNLYLNGNFNNATSILNNAKFILGGNGGVVMNNGAIYGSSETESLINGYRQTIYGNGTIDASIANFTNNGTLHSYGGTLTVSGNLTNWDGVSTLTGGRYIVSDNSTLRLTSIGTVTAGTTPFNLDNTHVAVFGSGLLTGDGSSNALTGLTNIADSHVYLNGVNLQITPTVVGSDPATLTLTADFAGSPENQRPARLTLDNQSSITVNGDFTNFATTDAYTNSSNLNVLHGSNLTVTGDFLNQAYINQPATTSSTATVNVSGGSMLNVASMTTFTNNSFANSNINVDGDGSQLIVTNAFVQGGSGANLSLGADTLNLTNAAFVQVGGDFQNNNGQNISTVSVDGVSTLQVGGNFSQTQDAAGFGASLLSVTNSGTVTVGTLLAPGDLTNATGINNGGANGTGPASRVVVTGNSNLNITGNLTNVSNGGLLSGGSYLIGNGSSLTYNGANINTIDVNTVVTLDNAGGSSGTTGTIMNGGVNALAGLAANDGILTLQNGASLAIAPGIAFENTFTNGGTLTTQQTPGGGGSNTLSVTGSIFNTSAGVVNVSGTGDMITATSQFTNGGTLQFNGVSGTVSSTDTFTNSALGIITMDGSGDMLSTLASLINEGKLTIGNTEIVTAALGVSQSGILTIDAGGSLTVQNGNIFDQTAGTTTVDGMLTAGEFDLDAGTLTGGGTIFGNVLNDGGTLNPGDPQSIEIVGNYDQTVAGIMDLDLAGTSSYDHVEINGDLTLDGTLDLTLEPGFTASVGDTFDIIDWTGTLTGDFSTFGNQTFNNGTEAFLEVVKGNQIDLDVVPTPEPSTVGMLFCAMLMGAGVMWTIRRRRQEKGGPQGPPIPPDLT